MTRDESTALAHQLIDLVEAIAGREPSRFAIAKSPDDVEAHFQQGFDLSANGHGEWFSDSR